MSEQITRTEVDSLIERLAETGINKVFDPQSGGLINEEEYQKDVMIGNVLERGLRDAILTPKVQRTITLLWDPCGLSSSLQEIAKESGWKKRYCQQCDVEHRYGDHDTLKSPKCNNLLVFINNLIK